MEPPACPAGTVLTLALRGSDGYYAMRLIRGDLAAHVNDPADTVSPTSRTVHAARMRNRLRTCEWIWRR
jgi:hypothetical protein